VTDITHAETSPRSLEPVVTTFRLISTSLRSGLLMSAGTALIAVPFVIGLGPAAVTTGIGIGGVMVALALAGTEPTGRGTIPVSAQAVYDRGIALGLVLVAIVFALAGEIAPTLVFAAAGLAALIVTSITRYSATPA
jgi:hypothetical protein